ncbi:MAG: methylenetetrahydrofolate reductase [Pseudomonadota bacterium]|nr:methylenetetrahydrofolate reductase [Pseudomonadota bacterium]
MTANVREDNASQTFFSRDKENMSKLLKEFSIEVMPRTAENIPDFRKIIPSKTKVYIAHIDGTSPEEMIKTAKRIREENFDVIPHLPARVIANKSNLDFFLSRYCDIGIDKALVLSGSTKMAVGEFENSMQLLSTGLFDYYNFKEVMCAGHPEGNKDIDPTGEDKNIMEALRWKKQFSIRTGVPISLTTQFCFELDPIVEWEKKLRNENIEFQINLGLSGPAKLQTLIKYALLCGVGPSIRVLQKRARDISKLLTPYTPEKIILDLSKYKDETPESNIRSVHFFPLGGIKATTDFLKNLLGTYYNIA